MEKTIKFTRHKRNFIIYKGKKYDYSSYSGRIDLLFEAKKMLTDKNYYYDIVNILGFNNFEEIYEPELFSSLERNRFEIEFFYNYRGKQSFIAVSKELIKYYIEYYKIKNEEINDKIRLSNIHLNENVDSFYEFDLQVELEGFEGVRFKKIGDFGTEICIPASNYLCTDLLGNEQLRKK